MVGIDQCTVIVTGVSSGFCLHTTHALTRGC
jgi:NADP-dependent 3-hydroxy acid dehydrogenase YdfG